MSSFRVSPPQPLPAATASPTCSNIMAKLVPPAACSLPGSGTRILPHPRGSHRHACSRDVHEQLAVHRRTGHGSACQLAGSRRPDRHQPSAAQGPPPARGLDTRLARHHRRPAVGLVELSVHDAPGAHPTGQTRHQVDLLAQAVHRRNRHCRHHGCRTGGGRARLLATQGHSPRRPERAWLTSPAASSWLVRSSLAVPVAGSDTGSPVPSDREQSRGLGSRSRTLGHVRGTPGHDAYWFYRDSFFDRIVPPPGDQPSKSVPAKVGSPVILSNEATGWRRWMARWTCSPCHRPRSGWQMRAGRRHQPPDSDGKHRPGGGLQLADGYRRHAGRHLRSPGSCRSTAPSAYASPIRWPTRVASRAMVSVPPSFFEAHTSAPDCSTRPRCGMASR